jgi:hypothetical protein
MMAIISGINASSSSGVGGPSPDYTPPSMIWKDTDEIYLPKGRYFKAGYRFNGQYQDLTNIGSYWDLADRIAVDIDATYSAGSTSGMIGGAKVISSWYSVFMVGQGIVVVLPFVRVDTITYSAPNTIITPAAHADGITAADGFIVANDAWNNYRLLLLNNDPTENGNVYTIVDTVNGTPDQILISGDVTSQIASTEYLQLVPPADVPCLYLGTIGIEADGSLVRFTPRIIWRTSYYAARQITGNASTTIANTDLALGLPPVARSFYGTIICASANNARGVLTRFYGGTSGSDIQGPLRNSSDTAATNRTYNSRIEQPLSAVSQIRNTFIYLDSSGVEQPIDTPSANARFDIMGYEE